MSRFKSSMFSTAAFAIILISNYNPVDPIGLDSNKEKNNHFTVFNITCILCK